MKIETKFNLDDEVFVIWENEVRPVVVISIGIRVSCVPTKIMYTTQSIKTGAINTFPEERLFATKQELIDSL